MIPPRELVRAVREYDATLAVRWAPRSCLWFVGKSLPPRLMGTEPRPLHSPRGLDVSDFWRAGFWHVLSVHPSLARNAMLIKGELARVDAWAQGGMTRLADALDADDEKTDASTERHTNNEIEAMTSEFVDHLAVLDHRRIFLTEPPPEPPGERRDGYVVRDRRRLT